MRSKPRAKRQFLFQQLEVRRLLASDFKLAILPDTQYYSESYPGIFRNQTRWLANHAQEENIVFVSHVGDVVDHASDTDEWEAADAAMAVLDGVIPYSVLPGNHDFHPLGTHDDSQNFVEYFGPDRYEDAPWYGGTSPRELNHYQTFSAGGIDFLHLALEWEPRPSSVRWAQEILDENPNKPVILTTHAYLRPSGNRYSSPESSDGLSSEELFDRLVTVNPQIFLVIGGHFAGEAHEVSYNDAGLPVLEVLADYQSRTNGGNGFMQLLNFRPDLDRIDVTTYSPLLDEYETDSDSEYSLDLNFDARLNLGGPPTVSVASPLDNGLGDTNPAVDAVTVNTEQSRFELELADLVPGIDHSTVEPGTVEVRRDGDRLSQPDDYDFDYDSDERRIILTSAGAPFGDGDYEITVNGDSDKITDEADVEIPTTTFDVKIDTAIAGPPDSLYFSLNSLTTFENGVVADNVDIVHFDGSDFSIFFDGSDVGLDVQTINAMTVLNSDEILLSFTGSTRLDGVDGNLDDSDIVKFTATRFGEDTSGTFSRYFDASDVGLTTSEEDIDAIAVLDNGNLLISTKGEFDVQGVEGNEEDLLEFEPDSLGDDTAGTWSLYFDGSDLDGLAEIDIFGVAALANGDLYLTTSGSFEVDGLEGKDEDVFIFTPTSTGSRTAGQFVSPVFFDGSEYGLLDKDIYSIHVTSSGRANKRPVAVDDLAVANEDGSATINVLVDSGNGADYDDDGTIVASSVTFVAEPAHGSLVNNGDGSVEYTPEADFYGTDTFSYRVKDNRGAFSDPATVTVSVNAVNDAPVAKDDNVVTLVDRPITIDVLADHGHGADSDIDGTVVASTAVAQDLPEDGALRNNGDGTFTYTPDGAFQGVDRFTYNVLDDSGVISNIATVTITVGDQATPARSVLYFALGETQSLNNGLEAQKEDIIAYDGEEFSIFFDGSDLGLDSDKIGSIAVISPSEILMSFRTDARIPGISGEVEPTDIVKFNATRLGSTTEGSFELYFRGRNVGLEGSNEDIDALHMLDDGRLVISTLSSFDVPDVSGHDEDLLVFTPTDLGKSTDGSWALYLDGEDVGWDGYDVDGVSIDDEGRFYFTGKGNVSLPDVRFAGDDVVIFEPTSLGGSTRGSYERDLFFVGEDAGLDGHDIKAIHVTNSGPLGLRAWPDAAPASNHVPETELTQQDVDAVLPFALAAWQNAGFETDSAGPITAYVAELPGAYLGQYYGSMIAVDRNAAGGTWHVDPHMPPAVAGQYDLLTVLAHEIGHLLGHDHEVAESVMAARLEAGQRLLPSDPGESHLLDDELIAPEPVGPWRPLESTRPRLLSRADAFQGPRKPLDRSTIDQFLADEQDWNRWGE